MCPRTTIRRFLTSYATPAADRPIASIFWLDEVRFELESLLLRTFLVGEVAQVGGEERSLSDGALRD